MKIVESTIRYYPALGGVEEYVRRISEGLVRRGHEVHVFASDLEDYERNTRIKDDNGEANGVKIIRSRVLPFRLKGYRLMPSLPLKLLMERAEVVHGHCGMYFSSDAAMVIAKLKKIPFIFNPYLADLGPPSWLGRAYRKTFGRWAMSADAVVVISEFEKRVVKSWGFKPRRVEVVPPGVDLQEFNDINNNLYRRYGIDGKNVVLFVGRLSQIKGLDVLIKAVPLILKEMPETIFVLVGADFGVKENLEDLATRFGVREKLLFLGSLPRTDVISAFKNASVVVLPSRYEAFGIVLIEAMAARVPVVATNYSAIPYIVRDGVTGLLFHKDDHTSLARQVIRVLKDGDLREELIESAYAEVIEKYNWENCVDRLEEIYHSVLRE